MNEADRDVLYIDFVKNIVARSFDEAIEDTVRSSESQQGIEQIAATAAYLALRNFFACVDLHGTFSVKLHRCGDKHGEVFDLEDYYEAPLVAAFLEEGWLDRYSRYRDQIKSEIM